MRTLRLVLVDDHALLRESVRLVLEAETDLKVVGEGERGEQACQLAQDLDPDVLIMDMSMPGLGGAAAIKRLQESCPDTNVLAFSAYEDAVYVRQLLAAGAKGYVFKRSAASELVRAIRIVARGDFYASGDMMTTLLAAQRSTRINLAAINDLSAREHDVLHFLARGFTNKELAELLSISTKTIETYKARILAKTGLRSRADIVRYAQEQGWFKDEVLATQ